MRTVISRVTTLLFSLLFVSSASHAITGPEVAQLLNSRYQNTAAECVGDNPAYFCSGVLLLASQGPGEFWKHDASSTTLGARSVAYVRADLDTRTLTQKNGAVFSDQFTAIGLGKPLNVLCAYPFEFPLQSTRPDFGCGWTATAKTTQDVSSCAALGVTDEQGWLAHFGQEGNQPAGQCSLSSHDPAQFMASLSAHQRLDADWSAKPTLLPVENWDPQAPKQLPLQGLFYDVTQSGSLLGAQKDQRDYFTATGDWLPILRMDLTQAPEAVFGFNQQDQLYVGYQVASRLNARYADTAPACRGDTAAYNCNGVLIRVTEASPSFHAWNPSPGSVSRNGVPFSYIRADVGTKAFLRGATQGLIMKELSAPSSYPLILRCSFASDGATDLRTDSCNSHTLNPVVSKPCDEQGVVDIPTWVKHFSAITQNLQCSFNADQSRFALSIEVRHHFPTPSFRDAHNEVVIAAWPQDIPERLPLEAFFYLENNFRASGLAGAQFMQRDFFSNTGRFLPVIRVNLIATQGEVFSYAHQDQTVETFY